MVLARYCEPVAVRHTVRSPGRPMKGLLLSRVPRRHSSALLLVSQHCYWTATGGVLLNQETLRARDASPVRTDNLSRILNPEHHQRHGVAQHWRLLMVNANIDGILYKQQLYWIFDVALIRQDSVRVLTLYYQRLPEKCKLCRKSEAVRVCLQRYRHNKQRRGLIRGDILLPNLITLWWDRTNVTILSEWLLLMPLMRLSVPKVAGTT